MCCLARCGTASTGFNWIAWTEDSLAADKLSGGTALLSSRPGSRVSTASRGVKILDGLDGEAIVTNYVDYFDIYTHWKSGRFSQSDSLALAKLAAMCPGRDGAVIYRARVLLGLIRRQYLSYNDDCFSTGDSRSMQRRQAPKGETQRYSLTPNPTFGELYLRQDLEDTEPVQIRIFSSVGALVHSSSNIFNGHRSELRSPDLAPGIYYLLLQDSQGNSYRLPFVKH